MTVPLLLALQDPPPYEAGGGWSMVSWLAILIAMGLMPFVFTMITSFAKLVIVGGIVRQAIGTPQIPPTSVITGLVPNGELECLLLCGCLGALSLLALQVEDTGLTLFAIAAQLGGAGILWLGWLDGRVDSAFGLSLLPWHVTLVCLLLATPLG